MAQSLKEKKGFCEKWKLHIYAEMWDVTVCQGLSLIEFHFLRVKRKTAFILLISCVEYDFLRFFTYSLKANKSVTHVHKRWA